MCTHSVAFKLATLGAEPHLGSALRAKYQGLVHISLNRSFPVDFTRNPGKPLSSLEERR